MRSALLILCFAAAGFYGFDAQACGNKMQHAGGGCEGGCGGGCGGQGGCGQAAGGCGGGCMQHAKGSMINRATHAIKTKVQWQQFDKAVRTARATKTPMLVHFSFGKQCDHCRQMAARTFNDKTLASVLNGGKSVIPVRIPMWAMTPAERALGEKLGYGEECLLALINADGQIVKAAGGRELKTRGIPDADALVETLQPLYN